MTPDMLVSNPDVPLDINLRRFLTYSLESATRPPRPIEGAGNCDDAKWASLISKRLTVLSNKRVDRLLRMVFKRVVRVLLLACKSEIPAVQ